jgi:pimeloyl-ACP methyl ester carboxylesterase
MRLPPATTAVMPFTLVVPQSELNDLKGRLAATRWPERETVTDSSQGAALARVQDLVEHWRTYYNWRRCEAMLNRFGQYRTQIQDLGIHFLHVRSKHENALPLILTHGWPGSIIEFQKVIGPLTDPTSFGGKAEDAFHVVVPSLPGFGFSDKPEVTGWTLSRTASAWGELMRRLGYGRYVAQGGDWGAAVTTRMAQQQVAGLAAIHLNFPILIPPPLVGEPNADEKTALAVMKHYLDDLSGYSKLQSTRPQTLGYALADSPVGQAAWIYDRFVTSTDSNCEPERVLTRDEMLDDIMIYWLTATANSSARYYWENLKDFSIVKLDLAVGCSIFPGDVLRFPKVWAERTFSQLIYWNEVERGGHFAALEQPEIFVREVQSCFRNVRQT